MTKKVKRKHRPRNMRPGTDPVFPKEWQDAANGAGLALLLDACRQYGLLEGSGAADVDRCRDIIARAEVKGIRPQKEVVDEAFREFVRLPGVEMSDELRHRGADGGRGEVQMTQEQEQAAGDGFKTREEHEAQTAQRRSYGDLKPGDRVILTDEAIRAGLHLRSTGRGGSVKVFDTILGEYIRPVTPRDGGGARMLLVRKAGRSVPQQYPPRYWRRVEPGEDVTSAGPIIARALRGEVLPEARGTETVAGTVAAKPSPPEAAYPVRTLGAEDFREMNTGAAPPMPALEKVSVVTWGDDRLPAEVDYHEAVLTSAERQLVVSRAVKERLDELADAEGLPRLREGEDVTVKEPPAGPNGYLLPASMQPPPNVKITDTCAAVAAQLPPVRTTIHAKRGASPETRQALTEMARAAARHIQAPPASDLPPDTPVWAINPHYRPPRLGSGVNVSAEVSRRRCTLRDVPFGWTWEPVEDDD